VRDDEFEERAEEPRLAAGKAEHDVGSL
jgi:hypothetical protein